MLHNRRLIARSCPIKSIDLGPSPDNYVRTVSNGSIYLALRSRHGCKVSDAILCESEPVWHFPWQCDIVPGLRVLTYQPHCYVMLCPNMSQCHATSDITSHSWPSHISRHTAQGQDLALIGFCKIKYLFSASLNFPHNVFDCEWFQRKSLRKIVIFYNEMKLSIWCPAWPLCCCHRHSIVLEENRGPKWASARESLCVWLQVM